MTGLHLLRTGEVETNLLRLNERNHRLPFIEDLVERKLGGKEQGRVLPGERDAYLREARRLEAELDPAAAASSLPESVSNIAALDEFLVRLRLGESGSRGRPL